MFLKNIADKLEGSFLKGLKIAVYFYIALTE